MALRVGAVVGLRLGEEVGLLGAAVVGCSVGTGGSAGGTAVAVGVGCGAGWGAARASVICFSSHGVTSRMPAGVRCTPSVAGETRWPSRSFQVQVPPGQ